LNALPRRALLAGASIALSVANTALALEFSMTTRNFLRDTPPDGGGELDRDEVFARRALAEIGGVAL
jgi:hypothetical protein